MDDFLQNVIVSSKKTADLLQEYYHDSTGWHTAKKNKDVIVEYKHSKCPGFEHNYLYRGQAEYNCSKETVFNYVDPLHKDCLRTKWDKDIKKIFLLKQVTPDIAIIRSVTNSAAMGLISPRDFVDAILTVKPEDSTATNNQATHSMPYFSTAGHSIEFDECPHDKDYVRGWNYPSGMMCYSMPDKPGTTKLVTFIQPDIKGSIPKTLVDSALPASMVGFFHNLRAILKKDGHLK